tara:strand:+ start:597 stop:794 length:198 start_codon:yes stop_codon:yes gene_type:complete
MFIFFIIGAYLADPVNVATLKALPTSVHACTILLGIVGCSFGYLGGEIEMIIEIGRQHYSAPLKN